MYIVSEGQSAIVLNLGKVVRSDVGPGLHFSPIRRKRARVPPLQVLDANPERYLTSDKTTTDRGTARSGFPLTNPVV